MDPLCASEKLTLPSRLEMVRFRNGSSVIRVGSVVGTPDGGGRCLLCTKTFKNLKLTRRHVKVVHSEGDPYECTICGRIIPNSCAFRTHINLKHGIKGERDVKNKYGRRLKDETQDMHFESAHVVDESFLD